MLIHSRRNIVILFVYQSRWLFFKGAVFPLSFSHLSYLHFASDIFLSARGKEMEILYNLLEVDKVILLFFAITSITQTLKSTTEGIISFSLIHMPVFNISTNIYYFFDEFFPKILIFSQSYTIKHSWGTE